MRTPKRLCSLSRPFTFAIIALFIVSSTPNVWSDETMPDAAAPPATSDVSNEGVPPAPAMDPGMGSPEEAPIAEEKPVKKKKKAAKAKKKKNGAKKKKKDAKKKKKKKKHHDNY